MDKQIICQGYLVLKLQTAVELLTNFGEFAVESVT